MLNDHELERGLTEAVGRVEYKVDGGEVILPTYKFATFDAGGTAYYHFFVGRDAEAQNNDTGVYITINGVRELWGVDIPLSSRISANYHEKGVVWRGKSGALSGMFVAGYHQVFFYFDFMAHKDSQSKHISGTVILKS